MAWNGLAMLKETKHRRIMFYNTKCCEIKQKIIKKKIDKTLEIYNI